jgi:flagellum-specific peptidoglycan hydrolase FlgJ
MRSIFVVLMLITLAVTAQPAEYRLSREEYIERYKDDAVREMLMHRIPASITLAQALVETGDGNSPLAKYANNHFGIKCHGWKEFSFQVDDDAYNECFRKYGSVDESYADHSKFLLTRPWYN